MNYSIDYTAIEELMSLRKERERIARQEEHLSLPKRNDIEGLRELYAAFKQIISNLPGGVPADRCFRKKVFLFIALYLYAPGVLAGGRMDKQIRKSIAEAMDLSSPSTVTYHSEGLSAWYTLYPDFREAVDFTFPRLVSESA